ncbi:MAG: sterol desaturase family protein, partial [Hyphomicrobium sp.]
LTDLMHFFFSGIMIRIGLYAIIFIALYMGNLLIPQTFRKWVENLPIWIQVVTVTLITDLGFYLSHRLMHSVPFLWNFHAVHHSSEQLDWLAAFRVHPIDQVIVKGSSLLPVFALGFSTFSIAIAGFIYQWQALLIHSNINLKLPFVKWFLATPDFHHWHHSKEEHTHNKNYAGQLPFWDIIFGTANMQSHLPETYGINEKMPQSYLKQLLYPFLLFNKKNTSEVLSRKS